MHGTCRIAACSRTVLPFKEPESLVLFWLGRKVSKDVLISVQIFKFQDIVIDLFFGT